MSESLPRSSASARSRRGSLLQGRWPAAALLLVAAGATAWFLTTGYFASHSGDLRLNVWLPASLLVRGQSPYGLDELAPGDHPLWLPTALGLLFPVGWLPFNVVANLWLLGSGAAVAAILWLEAGRPAPPVFGLLLLALLLFPPVAGHLVGGQFSLVVVLLLLAAARLVDRGRPGLAGLAVGLALTKAHLAALGALGLLLVLARQRGPGAGWRFALATVGGAALLTLPLWVGYPAWPVDYLRSHRESPAWLQPSSLTMLQLTVGPAGTWLWAGLFAGALAAVAGLARRAGGQETVRWGLALTPLVSPYVFSYDFVLVLPLLVRGLVGLPAASARVLAAVGFGLCFGLMEWIRRTTEDANIRYWWVPGWLLAFVVGAHLLSAWRRGRGDRLRLRV